MGPGFDSLGVALSMYNSFTFEVTDGGLTFEGCPEEFCNEENLAYVAFCLIAGRAGKTFKGLHISMNTHVPVARGLGSSSTLIVAGAVAANEMLGCGFTRRELLQLCIPLEGHADNLAPALLGGFTASTAEHDMIYTVQYEISDKLRFFALIPDFETKTSDARAVLPKVIPRSDAIYNLSRVAVLIRAFEQGDINLLAIALHDRLHEPYRRSLIKGFGTVKEAVLRAGSPIFFLSGSGYTCMCISDKDISGDIEREIANIPNNWKVYPLTVDRNGAMVID
jgi:homoserine kinase